MLGVKYDLRSSDKGLCSTPFLNWKPLDMLVTKFDSLIALSLLVSNFHRGLESTTTDDLIIYKQERWHVVPILFVRGTHDIALSILVIIEYVAPSPLFFIIDPSQP